MSVYINRKILQEMNNFLDGNESNELIDLLNDIKIPTHKLEKEKEKKEDAVKIDVDVGVIKKTSRKNYSLKDIIKVWELSYKQYGLEAYCAICNENLMILGKRQTWHMSHILSKANGGSSDIENIRAICSECNSTMGDEHMAEYVKRKYPERFEKILDQLKI